MRSLPIAPAGRTASNALWNLGFRPFYLLASIFAALSVALWVAQYAGYLPFVYVRSPLWHASEMIFGYTLAVIAGFLFTAVRNWTAKPTPTGGALAALALLWVAGRVLVATPYVWTAAFVNTAFPVTVAIGIAIPLVRAGNRRNYFFIALLVLIALAELGLHLADRNVLPWSERTTLQAVLDILMFIMAVMAGRVIPMFTNNGVPGARARRNPLLERAALGGLLVLALADIVQAPALVIAVCALALFVIHGARLVLWEPWRVFRTPLVWILHAAYAWIVVHLALRAFAAYQWVPDPIATHALTIGGIGGLTLGMMTRTARGHTGRPLVADAADVAAYALMMLAAIIRVFGALVWPGAYLATVILSGACWFVAFALYAATYAPSLTQPRRDGKAG